MPVTTVNGWLLSNGDQPYCKPGLIALLSYTVPKSAAQPDAHWLEIDEEVDGMACGRLHGFIRVLPVAEDRLMQVLQATDWSGGNAKFGWRHDLSWHDTKMQEPDDPTVQAYLAAIAGLGLAWTAPTKMDGEPYGRRLAQAAYPFDPTDSNLRALGIAETVCDLLGEPVDPSRHALVLLTPNDD